MTDLDLIKNLEQHAGFTLHRLGCDGNIYAKAVDLDAINHSRVELCMAFARLRRALTNIKPEELSRVGIMKSMDSFNIEDWND
jgi:hypothetical protein